MVLGLGCTGIGFWFFYVCVPVVVILVEQMFFLVWDIAWTHVEVAVES